MSSNHTYVAIMAGGIGSRFWPMSRTQYPKQFIDILNTGKTLIQQTFERYSKLVPEENIYVVTAEEYVPIVKEQLPGIRAGNILGEPSRKNTAPCVAYVSFKLLQTDPDAILIMAPSDHLVLETEKFADTATRAIDFVSENNAFVTLGIKPNHPNTGYGYIQHETIPVSNETYKVKTFTEKPNLELAKTFVSSGDFLWNAGIFIWKVSTIISAFEKYLPEMYEVFFSEREKFNTENEKEALEQIYPLCTNISIDFGIMEKAENVFVIPSSFGWSDLGTWNSAWDNMEKDYLDNAVAGKNVMIVDATRCMVHAPDKKLLVLQGLDDFIIVDTKDALLICKKDQEQEIKDFVVEIKRSKGDKYL